MNHFADRLLARIQTKQTPLMVGLDPRLANLPDEIRAGVMESDTVNVAGCFERFCHEIIDIAHSKVAVVKPQFGFFEQLGPAGMIALKNVVDRARQKGLLVIGDAKRGDIGSTAEGYANAYLNSSNPSAIICDALTVNPYMGFDTIEPFVKIARENGNGIFVLVKTSNPGGGEFQDLEIDERKIYQRVADQVQSRSAETMGESGYGLVGAVVGATYPEQLAELRKQMPQAILLIPGYGAQGGSAFDIVGGFDERGRGAMINSSRGIIFAYDNPEFQLPHRSWQECVAAAIDQSISEIAQALES